MISKEEVKHIAKLARLGITDEEIAKYQKELSSILDYVEKLKEVDVSRVEPTSHSVLIKNMVRESEGSQKLEVPEEQAGQISKSKELLELAPETQNGYLKVKSIL